MTQQELDKYYINVAELCSYNSKAVKLQVGAIIVKNNQIISDGFNGTPEGFDNNCETIITERSKECNSDNCLAFNNCNKDTTSCSKLKAMLKTKKEVLHAESNAILKCAKYGKSTDGATLYITHSPCIECAKLIIQAGIKRVVYLNCYSSDEGIKLLNKANISIEQYIEE